MAIKKMFYDCETTGVDVRKHSIHQISGCIEIDGVVVESFNFKVRPNPKAKIEPEALEVCGVTEEQILAYPEMSIIFKKVKAMLRKYCDPYNKLDKIFLIGFRNASFDDKMFRAWFEQNGDEYFGSWFWSDSQDVSVLASVYLEKRRAGMENFKLMTVARTLGVKVDDEKLHDAEYDIYLTRLVYMIVVGLEIEM
jgi:DNA polymerase-3 subunit epsilon